MAVVIIAGSLEDAVDVEVEELLSEDYAADVYWYDVAGTRQAIIMSEDFLTEIYPNPNGAGFNADRVEIRR